MDEIESRPQKCKTCGGSGWMLKDVDATSFYNLRDAQGNVIPMTVTQAYPCPECRKMDVRNERSKVYGFK